MSILGDCDLVIQTDLEDLQLKQTGLVFFYFFKNNGRLPMPPLSPQTLTLCQSPSCLPSLLRPGVLLYAL